jgi:hypothetical protein
LYVGVGAQEEEVSVVCRGFMLSREGFWVLRRRVVVEVQRSFSTKQVKCSISKREEN